MTGSMGSLCGQGSQSGMSTCGKVPRSMGVVYG